MPQGEERRTAPRTTLKRYMVNFSGDSFLARIGLGKKGHGQLVDASRAGIQIIGPEQLKTGERFRFILKGTGMGGLEIAFVGTVSWCRRSTAQRTFFKAGIRFEGIGDAQLDALQQILEQEAAKAAAAKPRSTVTVKPPVSAPKPSARPKA